jgi:RNA polymerase sigma-70 factor (ECF subfamily)
MIDWKAMLREDGPCVWRTVYRLLANQADAEDCFQETFADAIELSRKSSGSSIRSWRAMLVRLATARAVDRLRQRVRQRSHEQSDGNVAMLLDRRTSSRPSVRAEQHEMSDRLRHALVHLPPKQADAFCLHCLEGFSYLQVAEQMKESVDHVGVLIYRARADLRQRIGFILSGATTGASESRNDRLELPSSTAVDEVSHEQ